MGIETNYITATILANNYHRPALEQSTMCIKKHRAAKIIHNKIIIIIIFSICMVTSLVVWHNYKESKMASCETEAAVEVIPNSPVSTDEVPIVPVPVVALPAINLLPTLAVCPLASECISVETQNSIPIDKSNTDALSDHQHQMVGQAHRLTIYIAKGTVTDVQAIKQLTPREAIDHTKNIITCNALDLYIHAIPAIQENPIDGLIVEIKKIRTLEQMGAKIIYL